MPLLLLIVFAIIVLVVVVVWKVRPLRYLALTALGLSFAWTCLQALGRALSAVPAWFWWTLGGVVVAVVAASVAVHVVRAPARLRALEDWQTRQAAAAQAQVAEADRLMHEAFNADGSLKQRSGPPPRLTPPPMPPAPAGPPAQPATDQRAQNW